MKKMSRIRGNNMGKKTQLIDPVRFEMFFHRL